MGSGHSSESSRPWKGGAGVEADVRQIGEFPLPSSMLSASSLSSSSPPPHHSPLPLLFPSSPSPPLGSSSSSSSLHCRCRHALYVAVALSLFSHPPRRPPSPLIVLLCTSSCPHPCSALVLGILLSLDTGVGGGGGMFVESPLPRKRGSRWWEMMGLSRESPLCWERGSR